MHEGLENLAVLAVSSCWRLVSTVDKTCNLNFKFDLSVGIVK